MKKPSVFKANEDQVAVPVSVRLPAGVAYKLYLYAEQMGTSAGKMLTEILTDCFPAFDESKNEVTLRVPQVYKAMSTAKLLRGVSENDLAERILKRSEPGGDMG